MFSILLMSKERRAVLLQAFLQNVLKGDRSVLIQRSGVSKGRITQMLNDGFGELAARTLEASIGLPKDYFERPSEIGERVAPLQPDPSQEPTTPEEITMELQRQAAELVRAWLTLNEMDRNTFKREVESKALQNRDPVRDSDKTLGKFATPAVRPAPAKSPKVAQ